MWNDVCWIGVPREEIKRCGILEGDMTGRFAFFRLEEQAVKNCTLTLRICANSRYRLWINNRPVLSGPCKGDLTHCYFDTVDVSGYLQPGKNVFAVSVLYQDPDSAVFQGDERASIFGVVTPGGGHRLAVEGEIKDREGRVAGVISTGKAPWEVWLDGSTYLKSTPVTENLGAVCEDIDFFRTPPNWKRNDFEHGWLPAVSLETVRNSPFGEKVGFVKRFDLKERPIPLLYEKDTRFVREMPRDKVTGILDHPVLVPSYTEMEILLDAGAVVNGYPIFDFFSGWACRISIVYFEKFINPDMEIQREDQVNGKVQGRTDQIFLSGGETVYEPFWYRTFRFVLIHVKTLEDPLWIRSLTYRRTGYPLLEETRITSSDPWVDQVWAMCVRTLENCMMDTYMDCPYYEEMQFPMDTRLQMLFNYSVSSDVRLAKKALEDLHSSITPEGLVQGKYPSCYTQIISTFSLHYIFMLWEYYEQTGDLEGIRKYLPDVDRILYYYDTKIGSQNLVEHLGYWEFVDWLDAWGETGGVPIAAVKGPSTIINLMYGYALLCGADLYEAAGRKDTAAEYRERQRQIEEQVWKLCWDPVREMLREGPDTKQFTRHAQAWAVRNGLGDRETQRKMLLHAIEDEDVLKVTFATSYEWFRALEETGLYEESWPDMLQWIALPGKGCTTCPETPGNSRSDCHAWSALPMYELSRTMAGIRPEGPGWSRVLIKPHPIGVSDLSGQVITPRGAVQFDYQKSEGEWRYRVSLPEGLEGTFVFPDGKDRKLTAGETLYLS